VQLDSYRNSLNQFKSSVSLLDPEAAYNKTNNNSNNNNNNKDNSSSLNNLSESCLLNENIELEDYTTKNSGVELINQNLLVNVCNQVNELNK